MFFAIVLMKHKYKYLDVTLSFHHQMLFDSLNAKICHTQNLKKHI